EDIGAATIDATTSMSPSRRASPPASRTVDVPLAIDDSHTDKAWVVVATARSILGRRIARGASVGSMSAKRRRTARNDEATRLVATRSVSKGSALPWWRNRAYVLPGAPTVHSASGRTRTSASSRTPGD